MDEQFRHVYQKAKDMPQVNYSGSVPNEDIRKNLENMHILAYPSTYMETACITALESLSAKCLAVIPNLAALPETTANFAWMYNYEPAPDNTARLANVNGDQQVNGAVETLLPTNPNAGASVNT